MKLKDSIKQKDLEELGLKIMRVSTYEVLNDMECVLKRIEQMLNK